MRGLVIALVLTLSGGAASAVHAEGAAPNVSSIVVTHATDDARRARLETRTPHGAHACKTGKPCGGGCVPKGHACHAPPPVRR